MIPPWEFVNRRGNTGMQDTAVLNICMHIVLETHSARAAMPTNAHPYVHTAHAHTRRCCHCVATFDGSKPSLAATPSIIAFKR